MLTSLVSSSFDRLVNWFTLLNVLFLGAITRSLINYPIPEPVYGMIYLFIALHFNIIKSEDIKETSDGILKNLAFLFLPAEVGILANYDVIKGKIFQIIILLIIGTIISMELTGLQL